MCDERCCWSCGSAETAREPLVKMPCSCKGTIEFIHEQCLSDLKAVFSVCRTCKGRLRPETCKERLLSEKTSRFCWFVYRLMTIAVFVVVVVPVMCVCMEIIIVYEKAVWGTNDPDTCISIGEHHCELDWRGYVTECFFDECFHNVEWTWKPRDPAFNATRHKGLKVVC